MATAQIKWEEPPTMMQIRMVNRAMQEHLKEQKAKGNAEQYIDQGRVCYRLKPTADPIQPEKFSHIKNLTVVNPSA